MLEHNVWYWSNPALGDSIMALTALHSLDVPLTIKISADSYTTISSLISIFKLDKFYVKVVPDTEIIQIANTDPAKRHWVWDLIYSLRQQHSLFYYTPDTILAYGQSFSTDKPPLLSGKPGRPCVAIAINNGRSVPSYQHKQIDRLPYCKYYPQEYWKEAFDLVTRCEYDVMVIDSMNITIEQKAFLLNEFCMALIGYEGGLCHLAHTLKIPTFILPWTNNDNRMSEIFTMHFDKRTWFLESGNELINWTAEEFNQKITDLNNSKGNHPLI
jgi:hypothetical protein